MGARQPHCADDWCADSRASISRSARKWLPASVCLGLAAVAGALLVAIWPILSVHLIAGSPLMIGPHRDAKKFPTVNAVSGTPPEWIAAVCLPHAPYAQADIALFPADVLFLYPNKSFDLPRAVYSAACPARYVTASDPVVLVAEYRIEDTMQLELADTGIKWYCFAANHGHLFVLATRAEEHGAGSTNGLADTPVLAPLEQYGFNVYGDPGPSLN
jgi:hypothetical protein